MCLSNIIVISVLIVPVCIQVTLLTVCIKQTMAKYKWTVTIRNEYYCEVLFCI